MVVGDISTGTDVVVVGGGPAGYTAAIRAGQRGLDVTLVEKSTYGGTCLNHGCIPSKALISATDLAYRAGDAEQMGIHADPAVDFAAMVDWKDGIVDQLTGGVEKLCKANGVNLVEGTARFLDRDRLAVSHEEGGRGGETLAFEEAIIATGSRPIELPELPFDEEGIIDSREALALDDVPESLVVVGAGYIGMELAGIFAKLGSDVTVIEMLERALVRYEEDLVQPVVQQAEDLGVSLTFGHQVTDWERTRDGHFSIVAEDAEGDTDTWEAEQLLVAVGREPVTESANVEALGIETDEDGVIPTDARQETDVAGVYAVGDVAGDPMLAHVGMAEGIVASEAIAGEPAMFDHVAIPEVVFTDPEIAVVGMSASEAEEAGYTPNVGEFQLRASGRAMTVGRTDGFVRLVADAETDHLLGGAIVGHEASELIGELGLALELGATLEDIAHTIHTHPTLSEGIMEAAEHGRGEAIHRLNR